MGNVTSDIHYGTCKRLHERILRIGKSHGFGIQSPWAFSFVTEVIGEQWPYYGYSEIEDTYPDAREQKFQKLMLRVRNFVYSHRLLIIDDVSRLTDDGILQAANSAGEKGAIVIRNIYSTKNCLEKWNTIQQHEAIGITFDLYDFAICFFDRNIIKQHYKLNF